MVNLAPLTEYDLRRQIARACPGLHDKGLVAAYDGNVSARLPSGNLLVTPSGASKGSVTEEMILLCNQQGKRIRGAGNVSTEIAVHLAAYRVRPDIRSVVHAHPPLASAFTYAGVQSLLAEPVLPEVIARLGSIPSAAYATPGTKALGEAVAPLLKTNDAVLLAQHGAVTVGADPWGAYLLMEKVEQVATIVKAARELAGSEEGIRRLTPQQIADIHRSYGKPRAG